MIHLLLLLLLLVVTGTSAVPVPSVAVQLTSQALLGTQVTLNVTFSNAAASADSVGFSPFVDLYLTAAAVKGVGKPLWLSLSLASTTLKFSADGQCLPHPYLFRDLVPPNAPLALVRSSRFRFFPNRN